MKLERSLTALALAASVSAVDVLISSRMMKRAAGNNVDDFRLPFIHVNDIHAHFDQFASSGTDCRNPKDGCYGGYLRLKYTIDRLRKEHPNHILLNAGDEFQGTLFYTYYKGKKIAQVLNEVKFDAMTLGNHEFDGGEGELGEFLDNLTFPIVSCNIRSEFSALRENIQNYTIFEKYGVAVIGATTDTTPSISNVSDKTTFLKPIPEIQNFVYEIRNKTKINRIVALTHIGYDQDQKLAAETEGISLIIGGHSHTLLGNMKGAKGHYPTIVKNKNGEEVFVVTAYRWGEYLGYIDVTFDKDGAALGYRGGPIHIINTTREDKALQKQIDEWRGPLKKFSEEEVGNTEVDLDQTKCAQSDCLLGQVMADAMLAYRVNQTKNNEGDKPHFALLNSGSVRATIQKGTISRGDVLTSFPFGNAIVQLNIKGKDLRLDLEGDVSGVNQRNKKPTTSWIQASKGILVKYNPKNKPGSRLVSVEIGGKALDDDADYRVVTLDFVAGGGDNLIQPVNDFISLDTEDEVLTRYLEAHNLLGPKLDDRVVATDQKEK